MEQNGACYSVVTSLDDKITQLDIPCRHLEYCLRMREHCPGKRKTWRQGGGGGGGGSGDAGSELAGAPDRGAWVSECWSASPLPHHHRHCQCQHGGERRALEGNFPPSRTDVRCAAFLFPLCAHHRPSWSPPHVPVSLEAPLRATVPRSLT